MPRSKKPLPPVLEGHWEGDQYVVDRRGWPGEGERISDEVALGALMRGKLDIVGRYLREVIIAEIRQRDPCRTTDTLWKLADKLEARPTTDSHLVLKRVGRRGSPGHSQWQELALGAEIDRLLTVPGVVVKDEVLKIAEGSPNVCEVLGIKKSAAYKAHKKILAYRAVNNSVATLAEEF